MSGWLVFNICGITLKELCYYFINNINKINILRRSQIQDELLNVCTCYLLFTSDDKRYRKYLLKSRYSQCIIYFNEREKISIREILQHFDFEFNKLIVRINVEKNNRDIVVSWKSIYDRFKKIEQKIVYESIKIF